MPVVLRFVNPPTAEDLDAIEAAVADLRENLEAGEELPEGDGPDEDIVVTVKNEVKDD